MNHGSITLRHCIHSLPHLYPLKSTWLITSKSPKRRLFRRPKGNHRMSSCFGPTIQPSRVSFRVSCGGKLAGKGEGSISSFNVPDMTQTVRGASYLKTHQWWADLSDRGLCLMRHCL